MKDDSENVLNQNIIEENINSQINKKTRNNFGLNNINNKFNLNLDDGKTEEEIIFPTNTCLDEQSFFIMSNQNQNQSGINKNINDNDNNNKTNNNNKIDSKKINENININRNDINDNNKNVNSVSSISNINSMNSIKNITSINSILNNNNYQNNNIHNNNNKHASNKSELTKISNDIISDIFGINNHKNINYDYKNLNYDDLVFLQNSSPTSSEIMKNKKIVSDFILRNNYVKKREDKNTQNENNCTMKTNLTNNTNNTNNNNNMKRNDSAISFQNFLNREKRFENKKYEFKEKKMKEKDQILLNGLRDKPIIDKNSSKIASKNKNRSTKAYKRLYENSNLFINSNEKAKKNENRYNNISTNVNTKINKDINNNIRNNSKINNLKKKYTFNKRSKNDIRCLSSNNFEENKSNKKVKNDQIINKTEKMDKKTISKYKNKTDIKNKNQNQNKIENDKSFLKRNNTVNIFKKNKNSKNNNNKILDMKKSHSVNRMKIDTRGEELFNKYNSETATNKMNIFQINKANREIDDLISKDKRDSKKYGINYFQFCDLLFKLGFVYIQHNKNNSDIYSNELNDEGIKKLMVQPYLKTKITKEFILNEIKIINDAFNTILNNFKLQQDINTTNSPNENNNNNNVLIYMNNKNKIKIEDFKLFIFILTNLFNGYDNDLKKISTEESIQITRNITNNSNFKPKNVNVNLNYNSSTNSSKTIKSVNIHNININNINNLDKVKNSKKILHLIEKITSRKLDPFTYNYISYFKSYFNYMVKIKNIHTMFINNLKRENKKERLEENFNEIYTFSPKINKKSDIILNSIKPSMSFEERNEIISRKKSQHKLNIEKECQLNFSEDCTFNPKINNDTKSQKMRQKKENNEKNKNNINVIKSHEEIELEDILKYSFNPKLNKPINQKMFSQSPLNNDKLVKDKIKKLRNFNFNKKLNNYEKNNREILSKDVKKKKDILNYLINNVDEGVMRMGLEMKSNKDTFDIFINNKDKNKNNNNKNEFGHQSNILDILNSKNKYPLFEVLIKFNNDTSTLKVFANEDYEKLCLNFCKEHNLGIESYNQILESIKNKINEINGYSI